MAVGVCGDSTIGCDRCSNAADAKHPPAKLEAMKFNNVGLDQKYHVDEHPHAAPTSTVWI
jgi:hypothetical protein